MQFFDIFDIFGPIFLMFMIVPLIFVIAIIIIVARICRQGANRMTGGIVIEPPTFVIPDRYQGRRRADGTEMKTVRLPDNCPSCNASMSHEGIDWVGPLEARCNYCGGTVKARFEAV